MEKEVEQICVNDSYFLFYHMICNTFKTKNIFEGLDKALYLLKLYLNSGDITLFRKDSDENYNCIANQVLMNHSIDPISCIINKTSKIVEFRKAFYIDLNFSEEMKNMMLLHIKTSDNDYILSVNNVNTNVLFNKDFEIRLFDTLSIILNRADLHEKQVLAIHQDPLTKLNNRADYEKRINTLADNDEELVFGLFDLFRLKYVNDNYSHTVGDRYIVEAANILKKYWPEDICKVQPNNAKTNVKTGHELYRIGGDEFVLMTSRDNLRVSNLKSLLAAEEATLIDLGLEDQIPIGLNFGLITHKPGFSIKEESKVADDIMQEDKTKMYVKYGLERRK